jgi:hypothetical protein
MNSPRTKGWDIQVEPTFRRVRRHHVFIYLLAFSPHSPVTMFAGAQISLYPMCDDFVSLIIKSLSALDPYREQLRIETDDISTLLVGPPEVLFQAMRDIFVEIASSGKHVVMHATISRGCPGEPDAEICQPRTTLGGGADEESQKFVISRALEAVKGSKETGQLVSLRPIDSRIILLAYADARSVLNFPIIPLDQTQIT